MISNLISKTFFFLVLKFVYIVGGLLLYKNSRTTLLILFLLNNYHHLTNNLITINNEIIIVCLFLSLKYIFYLKMPTCHFNGHNFTIPHIHESQNLKQYFGGDIQKIFRKTPGICVESISR